MEQVKQSASRTVRRPKRTVRKARCYNVQTTCIAMTNRGSPALTIVCLLIIAVTLVDALPPASPLHCKTVYGVQKRETCFAVAQAAGLPLKKFLQFNPNINCNNLFIR